MSRVRCPGSCAGLQSRLAHTANKLQLQMRVQPRTRTSGEGGFLRFPCPCCCCFCACCCWPCWPCWPSTRCFLAAGSMPPCCSCSGSMAAAPAARGRAMSLGSSTDHRPWAAAWPTFRDVLNAGHWTEPASNLQAAQGRGASDRCCAATGGGSSGGSGTVVAAEAQLRAHRLAAHLTGGLMQQRAATASDGVRGAAASERRMK